VTVVSKSHKCVTESRDRKELEVLIALTLTQHQSHSQHGRVCVSLKFLVGDKATSLDTIHKRRKRQRKEVSMFWF
jgi:hypothetical protein